MIEPADFDSLGALLRASLAEHADRLCLIEANRERENGRWTYGEMAQRAQGLAATLQSQGCRRIAIVMSNQSSWHVGAIATFWIGATLVPLDPKLTPEECGALLEHAGADALLTEPHLRDKIPFAGRVYTPETDSFEGAVDPVERSRNDDACIVYSSGTGGRAKGCVLTHGAYLSQLTALLQRHRFRPGERYLSILPTNHAIDFMVGFVGAYGCGAVVVHLRTLRPEFVRDAFVRYRIAHMALVPMVLGHLATGLRAKLQTPIARFLVGVNRLVCRRRPRLRWSRVWLRPVHKAMGGNLTTLFVGGAFTEPDVLDFFRGLGIPVINGYGLTEACTVVTLADTNDYRLDGVGRALPGTEVRIHESDPNGVGEVVVRGPTLMSRYLDDADLTAKTLRDGWLHTGDVGRLDATGHLALLGRRKNMIVTPGGKNVYPEDIENAFAGLDVAEYCIFAAPYLWGERREQLVMVVRADDRAFAAQLAARNRRLPEHKRVHGYWLCNEHFPRTTSLKIKRHELADLVRAGNADAMVEL